jgi:phosphoinositide-3-kinase regulatory subunit 4
MEKMWSDYESVEPYLVPDNADETVMDVKIDYGSSAGSLKPFQVRFDFGSDLRDMFRIC